MDISENLIDFERKSPQITGITEFENESQTVNPNTEKVIILFYKPLNGRDAGIDFGQQKIYLILLKLICLQIKDTKS